MKRKKIATLLIAGVLALGIVGGSFAWFTSSDQATNKFDTAGEPGDNGKSGIEIVEPNWNENNAKNLEPNAKVNKQVLVESKVSYDQFVRVKLTKVQKDASGNIITTGLDLSKIKYNFTDPISEKDPIDAASLTGVSGKWVKEGEWYYYIGKLAGKSTTNALLESVTLLNTAGTEWADVNFDVKVDAEAIQTQNGAIYAATGWNLGTTSAVGTALNGIVRQN